MIGAQLQRAIYAALMASPPVAGGQIYDRVSDGKPYPHVTIGDDQVIENGTACYDGWEVFADVHIWSRSVAGSKAEAKDLAAVIVARLATPSLKVSGFRIAVANLQTSRTMRDRDGLTEHLVITIRFLLFPTA